LAEIVAPGGDLTPSRGCLGAIRDPGCRPGGRERDVAHVPPKHVCQTAACGRSAAGCDAGSKRCTGLACSRHRKAPKRSGLETSTVPQPGLATPGGSLTVTFSLPHSDTWSAWYQLVDANPERSPRDMGEHFGLKPAAVSRRLTTRTLTPCTHGEPERAPDDAIQRIATVHSGAPDGSPATAHPRPVKDVLDLALHRVLAQVGQEVGRA